MKPLIASILLATGCAAVAQPQSVRVQQVMVPIEEPVTVVISNNPPFDEYYE